MSGIGDLWFALRGDDRTLITDATKAGDKAGTGFANRFKKGLAAGKLGESVAQGVGIGGGLSAWSLLDRAISGTIGLMGDAVAAARADKLSQQQLGTALKANIPAWDGNTDAIEKVLAARINLGFSDDEQRDSLKGLVAATHDVNKALAIQRTAMDLARFKGISLAEAGNLLIKVQAGQFRALKALGIQLPKNATAQDALNAIQAVAAGQAEDYANGTGKSEVAQVKLGEALEQLGYVLLPLVTDATLAATGAATDFATTIANTSKDFQPLIDILNTRIPTASEFFRDVMEDSAEKAARLREEAQKAGTGLDAFAGKAKDDAYIASKAITSVGDAADDAADVVDTSLGEIVASFTKTRSALEAAASGAADAIYDPIITKSKLAALEREMAEDRQTLASKTATVEQKRDATDRMTENNKKKIQLLATLASYGDKSAATTLKTMAATMLATGKLSAEQIADLRLLLSWLDKVEGQARQTTTALHSVGVSGKAAGRPAPRGKAAGGYVPPGWVGDVGEIARERLVMFEGGGGYVIPSIGSQTSQYTAAAAGTDAQSGTTWAPVIHITNPVPRAAEDDIGLELRRLAALGAH